VLCAVFSLTPATLYPATSVDVERVFSCGRILLHHTRNRLSMQSTRATLCLGQWHDFKIIDSEDVLPVAKLPDIEGDEEVELPEGWDAMVIDEDSDVMEIDGPLS
jgi:hypothetical protein